MSAAFESINNPESFAYYRMGRVNDKVPIHRSSHSTVLEALRSDVQKESLRQIDRKLELNAERRKALAAEKERLEKDVSGSIHQADSFNDLIRNVAHGQPGAD